MTEAGQHLWGMSLEQITVTTTSPNCPATGIRFIIIEMSAGYEGEGKAAFFQCRIPAGLTLANFSISGQTLYSSSRALMLEIFAISATLKSLLPRARRELLCIYVFILFLSFLEESRTVLPVRL
jgi:hypothetical protein